jgi:hypothetical protein
MNNTILKSFSLLIFLVVISISNLYSQAKDSTCKVLLKEISGSYNGSCKKGLADGKGTATGDDSYTGNFANGLPDGKGVYIYENGNVYKGHFKDGRKDGKGEFKYSVDGKTTTLSGYWKDGDYVGLNKPDEEYLVTNKSNIEYFTIKRTSGDENTIEISFEKVMKKYIPTDLSISLTSGNQLVQNLKILIEHYIFPVNCSMHFTIQTSGGTRQCFFAFSILKPGKYEVFISNS